MLGLGLPELIIILTILLLMFGATRLPKLARSLGESAGEIQKGFQAGVDKKDN
jgi:sec-independent protein translocase protein TatA